MQMTDGKIGQAKAFRGLVEISATQVRVIPAVPSTDEPIQHFEVAAARYLHKPGSVYANIGTSNLVYAIAYVNNCYRCAKSPPPPATSGSPMLDAEYDLIGETLRNYPATAKRISGLAQEMRIAISPDTEPHDSPSAATWTHYAALNHQLAASCGAEAATCAAAYETFQTCEANRKSGRCFPVVTCSATCVLPKRPDFGVLQFPLTDEQHEVAILPKEEVPESARSSKDPAKVAAAVMAGRLVKGDPPVYPPIALAAHMQGSVTLHGIITKEGNVERLEALGGPPMLKQAALDAVKQWTYRPYMINGEPAEVDTTIIVNFNLSHGPSTPMGVTPMGQSSND